MQVPGRRRSMSAPTACAEVPPCRANRLRAGNIDDVDGAMMTLTVDGAGGEGAGAGRTRPQVARVAEEVVEEVLRVQPAACGAGGRGGRSGCKDEQAVAVGRSELCASRPRVDCRAVPPAHGEARHGRRLDYGGCGSSMMAGGKVGGKVGGRLGQCAAGPGREPLETP